MDVDADTTKRLLDIRDKMASYDYLQGHDDREDCYPSEIFRDYVENHELPMFLVDEQADILYCNRAAQRFFNKPLNKIIGFSGRNLYADHTEFERLIQEIRIKGRVRGRKVHINTSDGSWPCLIYTSIRRNISGQWLNSRCLLVPLPKE